MVKKYFKPSITKKKLKINYFYSNSRYLDSLNQFQEQTLTWSNTCVSVCLMPDTKIQLYNAGEKEIKDVLIGDEVVTYDLALKKTTHNRVKQVLRRISTEGYLIINKILKITKEHSVWTNGEDWIKAGNLKIGDNLLSLDEKQNKVIEKQEMLGKYEVYNLEIEGDEHNFFAEGILVHNIVGSTS